MNEPLRPRSQAAPTGRTGGEHVYSRPLGGLTGAQESARVVADPGTVVEVTWAEELFQPVAFNSFRVGPFKATGTCRSGESIPDAMARLWTQLNESAVAIRARQMAGYIASLEQLHARMNEPRR